MAKDEPSNQLNLTVVALVALVAIVGLVALVMNAASIRTVPSFATGSEIVSATDEEQNAVGDAKFTRQYADWGDAWGAGGKSCKCGGNDACAELLNKKQCDNYGCSWSCK